MAEAVLSGGFADAPREAAHAFRAIMTAMARPGTIQEIAGATPPPGLSAAAGAVILTLADPDTPVWLAPALETPAIRGWIDFHTGAPKGAPEVAVFAIGTWEDLPRTAFPVGTPDYPDRSTTCIVEMAGLSHDGPALTGPGIETEARLNLPDAQALRLNAALFPLGHDHVFCSGRRIAALPRSTKIGER